MLLKLVQILLFCLICSIFCAHSRTDCMPRSTKYGLVCVCNATYCDYSENRLPIAHNIVLISSSKKGQRFAVRNLQFGKTEPKARTKSKLDEPISNHGFDLNVNRSVEYQKITGFGGSFTGSVSHLLGLLEPALQDHIYRSYYHKDGIGFNLMRIPIGGCDFDLEPWAYNEIPQNDYKLSNFTKLDPRDELKVQQLLRLKLISKLDDLKIMASAWSSPPWMKTNNNWFGASELQTVYYQAWADYHLRFIELMNARNMPIWSISTGNEPTMGNIFSSLVVFMSLGWEPITQGVWLNDHLGPTIRKSKYKNVIIFGNDDERFTFPYWFTLMKFIRPGVLDYLDGLASHAYMDDIFDASLIDMTVAQLPGKLLLNTEFSLGAKADQTHAPELGSWERGESYVRDFLLPSLEHSYNGWIDWNIILNEKGGPNYMRNYVDAPIIVNATNRAEFYKQPMFYAMGHFSKFVPEGSVRIDVEKISNSVEAVAFKRPDKRIVIVVLNSDKKGVGFILNDSEQGPIEITIPAKSWHSIIYN